MPADCSSGRSRLRCCRRLGARDRPSREASRTALERRNVERRKPAGFRPDPCAGAGKTGLVRGLQRHLHAPLPPEPPGLLRAFRVAEGSEGERCDQESPSTRAWSPSWPTSSAMLPVVPKPMRAVHPRQGRPRDAAALRPVPGERIRGRDLLPELPPSDRVIAGVVRHRFVSRQRIPLAISRRGDPSGRLRASRGSRILLPRS